MGLTNENLTENDIIESLKEYFVKEGYEIKECSTTNQHGIDLVVKKNNDIIKIEAKGATSSKKNSNRYGKEFSSSQVKDHIAKALLKTLECLEFDNPNVRVAMAFPNNSKHRAELIKILPCIKKLRIIIYLVDKDKKTLIFV